MKRLNFLRRPTLLISSVWRLRSIVLVAGVLLLPSSAFAQAATGGCNGQFNLKELFAADGLLPPFLRSGSSAQNADFSCLGAGIRYYTDLLALVVGVAAFFYILYGAFLYMTTFGDEAKAAQAKKVITQALVGLVLAALAFAIISLVNSTLGGGASLPPNS